MRKKWFILCFWVLTSGAAAQSQIDVKKSALGEYTMYDFKWADRHGKEYSTKVRFHNQDLRVGSTEIDPRGSIITVTYSQGEDPQQILKGELAKRKKALRPDGSVIHDYVGLKWRYQAVMKNLAYALNQQAPVEVRNKIEFFVDFFRQFKYSDTFNNGGDFQSPVGVLTENQGDCDSLSVAFASVMANLNIPVAFILVPDHLFMAVAMRPGKNDQHLNYGGRSYVFVDLTWYGSPLGKVNPLYMDHLKSGKYDFLL